MKIGDFFDNMNLDTLSALRKELSDISREKSDLEAEIQQLEKREMVLEEQIAEISEVTNSPKTTGASSKLFQLWEIVETHHGGPDRELVRAALHGKNLDPEQEMRLRQLKNIYSNILCAA